MDEKMKELLTNEVLAADNADTIAYFDDMTAFHQKANETLRKVEDPNSLKKTTSTISKARSSALKDFLERKKLVKETLEELS